MRNLFVAVTILGCSLLATAQQVIPTRLGTGMSLLDYCQNDADLTVRSSSVDGFKKGYCEGLVRAVCEASSAEREASIPPEVTLGQEVEVVKFFLQSHPELLHKPDVLLVHWAIMEAFPYQAERKSRLPDRFDSKKQ